MDKKRSTINVYLFRLVHKQEVIDFVAPNLKRFPISIVNFLVKQDYQLYRRKEYTLTIRSASGRFILASGKVWAYVSVLEGEASLNVVTDILKEKSWSTIYTPKWYKQPNLRLVNMPDKLLKERTWR